MLIHRSSATPVEMLPGVVRRTLNEGARTMLIEVTLEQGAVVPPHTHPHEQIGYLASGRLLFEVGDERRELSAGDSWLVPPNVPHQVTALEPSVAIDVFSPPREEYRT
jgi:quercetin dioxygenase-like cupin family protein